MKTETELRDDLRLVRGKAMRAKAQGRTPADALARALMVAESVLMAALGDPDDGFDGLMAGIDADLAGKLTELS